MTPDLQTLEQRPPAMFEAEGLVLRLERAAQLRQRLLEVFQHRFDFAALVKVEDRRARRGGRGLRTCSRQRLADPARHRLGASRHDPQALQSALGREVEALMGRSAVA